MTTLLIALVLAVVVLTSLRWRRGHRAAQARQRLEDALKHLFEQQYRGRKGSLSSLSGALRLADSAVVRLIERMQAQGLVTTDGQEFQLTPHGERLALQVVRAHRLLERYFADEARLPLSEIHAAAERREHSLTPSEADRLSASLGHPAYDPHGDPIPSSEGAVPPPAGTPATSWPSNTTGRIVHLEDEPEISFKQIVAEGLRVGQLVRIVDSTPERLVLSDGESEFRLAPVVAANVFLAAAPDSSAPVGVIPLSRLPNRERAQVIGLDDSCQGFSRRRLMDLGFTEGAVIRPFLQTFAGDPRAYEVRGTLVALRNDQASQVMVRPVAENPARSPRPGDTQ